MIWTDLDFRVEEAPYKRDKERLVRGCLVESPAGESRGQGYRGERLQGGTHVESKDKEAD